VASHLSTFTSTYLHRTLDQARASRDPTYPLYPARHPPAHQEVKIQTKCYFENTFCSIATSCLTTLPGILRLSCVDRTAKHMFHKHLASHKIQYQHPHFQATSNSYAHVPSSPLTKFIPSHNTSYDYLHGLLNLDPLASLCDMPMGIQSLSTWIKASSVL
jgi:hypothetical protein